MLGQVLTDDALVDGIRVPAGTTLFSPSIVSTDSDSAIVQLGIAQVLTLGENTTAKLEEAVDGVAVDVRSGSVAFLDRSGQLQELGEGTYRVEGRSADAPVIDSGRPADSQTLGSDPGIDSGLGRDSLRTTDRRANVASREAAADDRGEKWWWRSWWGHSGGNHDDGGHGDSGGHDDGGGHDGGGGHDDGGHGHGKQSPSDP